MPEFVQEIGAYAGLAAVVGLAVLSALYFSQARDVKRLREWAGRAPERTAEGIAAPQVAQRVVAQPQQKQPAAGQATTPPGVPGKPAPAPAAAAGATPAVAKAKPATPAAQKAGAPVPANAGGGKAAEAPGVPVPAGAEAKDEAAKDTEAKPPVPVTAGAPAAAEAEAEDGAATPDSTAAPAPTAQAGTAAPPKPGETAKPVAPAQPAGAPGGPGVPSTPAARRLPTDPAAAPSAGAGAKGPRFPSRRPAPSPSETAILPPSARPDMPWHKRLLSSPRYLVLAVAGVLIIGGGAAFGLSQLGKEEAPPGQTEEAERFPAESEGEKTPSAPAIDPAEVTVSVLNGTTVPGLAAQIGDKIESSGFQLGNVTNNSDQTRNESVVLFAPGGEREAAVVGRRLRIGQREPIDAQSQALGGDARVVVIAGADQTQ